jgi:hypothetical protein
VAPVDVPAVRNPEQVRAAIEAYRHLAADLEAQAVAEQAEEGRSSLQKKSAVVASATAAVAGSFYAGYVIWCVRGGALLASMFTSLPFWRWIDPLPVLDSWEQGREQAKRKRKSTPRRGGEREGEGTAPPAAAAPADEDEREVRDVMD